MSTLYSEYLYIVSYLYKTAICPINNPIVAAPILQIVSESATTACTSGTSYFARR